MVQQFHQATSAPAFHQTGATSLTPKFRAVICYERDSTRHD